MIKDNLKKQQRENIEKINKSGTTHIDDINYYPPAHYIKFPPKACYTFSFNIPEWYIVAYRAHSYYKKKTFSYILILTMLWLT